MDSRIDRLLYYFRYVLLLFMAGTIVFIFVNSCLPPEVSSEQSTAVGNIITSIIPEDTRLYDFVLEYIRKIAHFTEYGLLGIEVAVYVALYKKERVISAVRGLLLPFFVGFADETLQTFSDRGPLISDVWIDIGGFVTFSLIAYTAMAAAYYTFEFFKKKTQKEKSQHSDG